MNLNKVILIGRIASEIDNRNSRENNYELAKFLLAVNKRNRGSSTNVENANFIPISAWRQNAVFVTKYLTKGSLIAVEGYINMSRFTSKVTGALTERFEIVGETIESLETRSANEVRKLSKNQNLQGEIPQVTNTEFDELSSDFAVYNDSQIKRSTKHPKPKKQESADFSKFEGNAEDFLESLRVFDPERQQATDQKNNDTEVYSNVEIDKNSQAVSETIISTGKKKDQLNNIINFIWDEEESNS